MEIMKFDMEIVDVYLMVTFEFQIFLDLIKKGHSISKCRVYDTDLKVFYISENHL